MTESQGVKKGNKKKHIKFGEDGKPQNSFEKKAIKSKLSENGVVSGEVQQRRKQNKKKVEVAKTQAFALVKHKEDQKWYDYQVDGRVEDPKKDKLDDVKSRTIFDEAQQLLAEDIELHAKLKRSQGGSESSWLLSVIKKGTAADRMAGMQLQVNQSPVHSLPYIHTMVTVLEKKNTREAMDVIPILEEIFMNFFLPPNRKLLAFSSRPLSRINEFCSNSEQGRKRILVLWMFEHQLKLVYERMLKALESIASGVVVDLAKRSLKAVVNLLAERPEAEQSLLTLLVNKLGHPNYQVGCWVSDLLEQLSRRQPAMRLVIIDEVERLVYRKNVSERAHRYAATFLSQMMLTKGDNEVANRMLSIYFGLFKTVVSCSAKKRSDSANKLMSILLGGANRAYPYTNGLSESLLDDIQTLFKVVHTGSFAVSLQTLKLLAQVMESNESITDRFFTALYRKLFDPIPPGCYNQLLFLLFKTLKADVIETRVRAFTKRLIQLATTTPSHMTAAILILVSKLATERNNLLVTIRYADTIRSKLLSKSMAADEEDEERYMDVGLDGKPIVKVDVKDAVTDDDISVDSGSEEDEKKKPMKGMVDGRQNAGWTHKLAKINRTPYDPDARNPLHIEAGQAADTELVLLSRHFHPSIAIFAQTLIDGKPINYRGDPLEDFTQMKFLDRFAYKNPKDKDRSKTSTQQKVTKKKAYNPWGVKRFSVTSQTYLDRNTRDLPADEKFLHRYASLTFKKNVKKEKKEDEDDDDWEINSVASEEFDRIMDRFEPGESNDVFDDIDFTQEFTSEKSRKGAQKRKALDEVDIDEDDDEADDDDDEEDGEGDEDDDDDEVEADDEEEEEEEDVEMESDENSDEGGFVAFGNGRKKGNESDDMDDDDDFGNEDATVAADRFGALLEDMEEEERFADKQKKKRATKKPKGRR